MTDPEVPIERSELPRASAAGLETGVQIGDFRIERRIGAGGMGIVYQARQLSLNRLVALKVLGQALTHDTDVTRFQREAQAAARLRHPSIAQVYYIGQDRHICYMAMELVDGISLRRVLDQLGNTTSADTSLDTVVKADLAHESEAVAVRFDLATETLPPRNFTEEASRRTVSNASVNPYLSPKACELRTSQSHVRRCAEVVRDAAECLAHAHEQGVVHRDIKPDNLLLDRQGKLHLIDFGVARFFEDQAVTYTGQLVGTPLYMSPEQITGRGAIDARTDIYSLGLVLYELLTLRPPVEATNRENLLRNIVTKPLPPVTWRNEAVPENLARIVHRATQKDADQRYASAKDLAADLDRFLNGKPVTAPPYHYRLDEREITAARPSRIVLSAFVVCLISTVMSLGLACFGVMTMFMMEIATLAFSGIQILVAILILAGGIGLGRGLLAARTWARWTIVALLLLLFLVSSLGLISISLFASTQSAVAKSVADESASAKPSRDNDADPSDAISPDVIRRMIYGIMAMYAVPLTVAVLLSVVCIGWLVSSKTSEWFRFAAQIRQEHRAAKDHVQSGLAA